MKAVADTGENKVHGGGVKSKASKLASRHHRRKRRREQRVEDAPPYPTYSQPDVGCDVATTNEKTNTDQGISVPPSSSRENKLWEQSSEESKVNHPNNDIDSHEETKERIIARAPPAIASMEQHVQGGHLAVCRITCKKVCEAGDNPNENRDSDTEQGKHESLPMTKTAAGDLRRQRAERVKVKKVGMDVIEMDCSEDGGNSEELMLKASRKSRIEEKKASDRKKKANNQARTRKRPKPARGAKEPSGVAGNRCKDEAEQGRKRTKSEIGTRTQAKLAPGEKNRCHACSTCDCCNRDSTAKTPPPATKGTSRDFCSDARIEQSLLNRINKHNRHIDWCVSTRDKTYRDLTRHRRGIQKKKGSSADSIDEGAQMDRFLADAESTHDLESKVAMAIDFAEIKRANRAIFGGKPKSEFKTRIGTSR